MRKWVSRKPLISAAFGLLLASLAEPSFAASYIVKKDDTFFKIAQERKILLQTLLSLNKGIDPMNLQIGQAIKLPDSNNAATASVNGPKAPVVATYATASAPEPAAKVPAPVKAAPAPAPKNTVKTASGKYVTYKKALNCVATAYTASPEENGGWAGLDYMGNKLKVGTIAVDPSVIPLGSTLYITGYKHGSLPAQGMIAKATDVGGAIKGSRVDIFVPGSNASSFGMQNVKVYVLK